MADVRSDELQGIISSIGTNHTTGSTSSAAAIVESSASPSSKLATAAAPPASNTGSKSSPMEDGIVSHSSAALTSTPPRIQVPVICSLAEWQVELSTDVRDYLQRDLSSSESSSSSLNDVLEAMKVPPATTVVRWNPPLLHMPCIFSGENDNGDKVAARNAKTNATATTTPKRRSKVDALRDLQAALDDWLVQREQQQRAVLSSVSACHRWVAKVTEHDVLPDVVCIAIVQEEYNHLSDTAAVEVPTAPARDDSLYTARGPRLDTMPSQQVASKVVDECEASTEPLQSSAPAFQPLCSRDGDDNDHNDWRRVAGWPSLTSGDTTRNRGSVTDHCDALEQEAQHIKVVIVDRLCGEAILRGAHVYIPGVLCTDSILYRGDCVAVYADMGPSSSHNSNDIDNANASNPNSKPAPLTRGMRLAHYTNRTAVFMGIGAAECHRSHMFAHPPHTGLAVTIWQTSANHNPHRLLPPLTEILSSSPGLERDWHCQNLPSMTVPLALLLDSTSTVNVNNSSNVANTQDGDKKNGDMSEEFAVLDMCCAPGGKTSHLASLLFRLEERDGLFLDTNVPQDTAKIMLVACDKSRRKVIQARDVTWKRLGCSHCITPLALDTTKAVLTVDSNTPLGHRRRSVSEVLAAAPPSAKDGLLNVAGFYPESFDRILLDPPCSALGLRPKLSLAHVTVPYLDSVCAYQRQFIANAVALLKPGGYMTYSTCTIHTLENEGMVRYMLDHYPCLQLVALPPQSCSADMGEPGLPGGGTAAALTPNEYRAVRRFDPARQGSDAASDTMGFLVAKFKKIGAAG